MRNTKIRVPKPLPSVCRPRFLLNPLSQASDPLEKCYLSSTGLLDEGTGALAIEHLTVKERILLHLFDYTRFAEKYEVPVEVTQAGIAKAVGVRAPYVTQYVKPLLAEGLLEEKSSHIKRKPRRRKVYFLTSRGRQRVASRRRALLGANVPFRSARGETEELPLSRIYQEARRGSSVLELLEEFNSAGYILEVPEPRFPGVVDFSQGAQPVPKLYGRERELHWALDSLDETPIVVITGMAGMGKTALGSEICESLRGDRSLLWRRVRPWDTASDLALSLADFLKAHGRLGLHAYLGGHGPKSLNRIGRILASDLRGIPAVLVLDDVQTASEDAENFLSVLLEALRGRGGTAALMLSREVPGFYNRREVTLERSVVELSLSGLDRESRVSLLSDAGIAGPRLDALLERAGGSPLFLKMVARIGTSAADDADWSTLETYIAEEIEPSLTPGERACLRMASLYEVPVAGSGLLLDEVGGTGTILSLQRKGLLDRLETGRFLLHDFLRSYFRQGIPPDGRRILAGKLIHWLREEAEKATERGMPQDGISYLENGLMLEDDSSGRSRILDRLAELRKLTGDWPGAAETYRGILKKAEEPQVRAQLHRKIARCYQMMNRLDEAEEEVGQGLRLLPPGPSLEVVRLLWIRLWVVRGRRDFDTLAEQLEQLENWMSSLPEDLELQGSLAIMRGVVHLDDPSRRDIALAQASFKAAMEAFVARGEWVWLSRAHINYAHASFEMGNPEEALSHVERALEFAESAGSLQGRLYAQFVKARILSECFGDFETAEALYNEAYALAKMSFQPHRLVWFHRHFADLYRRQGRLVEAREALEHFLTVGETTIPRETRIESMTLMARLSIDLGDEDSARVSLRKAEELDTQSPSEATSYYLGWTRGALHAFQGQPEEAGVNLQWALSLDTPVRRGVTAQEALVTGGLRGETLLDYGRFLASVGENEKARESLLTAMEELHKLHRKPLEEIVVKELQALRYSLPA